jgi:L-seryl-tRNA(Ser) seleniumtransferase
LNKILDIVEYGSMIENELRNLPSVDKIISEERVKQLHDLYPHSLIVDTVRQRLEQERVLIAKGNSCATLDKIIEDVLSRIKLLTTVTLHPIINASGVILHTNLGRAPLSQEAIEAMIIISKGYCNLEFDLENGVRGSRQVHIESLLCQLTGAEAALVVNNNASAVLLALTALAKRKEVIVSRGEAVEIGGGFRIPDVLRQSGAKLIEVGTTNCTYDYDYEQAISTRTAALLHVHPSNFKVEGFTRSVTIEELVAIGNKHDIPVFDDMGSGCFLDVTAFGLAPEPMVQRSIALGVGLACFSGDKLVGGPQAGIIVGKKFLVNKLKKHPLARALRIDKTRLAGLAATLIHYLKGDALEKVPIWRMISVPLNEVEERAKLWAKAFDNVATVVNGETMLGGGSLPGSTLPTRLVSIGSRNTKNSTRLAHILSKKLRQKEPPIVGRVSGDVLLLDPRSVLPEDDEIVIRTLKDIASNLK